MGLFSSKKKTGVATAVTRVVERKDIVNTTKIAVITALMEDGSIPEYLVDNILTGTSMQFDRYWRYARDHYAYGLPQQKIVAATHGKDATLQVLKSIWGNSVNLEYFKVGAPNGFHNAKKVLIEDYGYDTVSNVINSLVTDPVTPVYLEDLKLVVGQDTFEHATEAILNSWELPGNSGYTPKRTNTFLSKYTKQTPPLVDTDSPDWNGATVITSTWPKKEIQVDKEWDAEAFEWVPIMEWVEDTAGDPTYDVFHIELTNMDMNKDYIQVKFFHNGSDDPVYWAYEIGSGEYPLIDTAYEKGMAGNSTHFPFVYYRLNGVNQTAGNRVNSDRYKTSVALLKHINMDYQDVCDSIHDNPDIDDVEQCVQLNAIPLLSDDPLDIKYLFKYFEYMHSRGYGAPFPTNIGDRYGKHSSYDDGFYGSNSYVLAFKHNDFRMEFGFTNILMQASVGNKGEVGTYTSSSFNETQVVKYEEQVGGNAHNPNEPPWFAEREKTYNTSGIDYFYQSSPNTYVQLRVVRPFLHYEIYGGKGMYATRASAVVPLDKAITDTFSSEELEILMPRSLHIVFNTKKTVTVKWYESGLFRGILTIVAIIITVYTRLPALKLFVSTLAGMSIGAAAWAIAQVVIKMAVFKYGFEFVTKELGEGFAIVAAIVAAIYVGVSDSFSLDLPMADQGLQASTGFMKAAQASYQDRILGIQSDYDELLGIEDERQERLEEAAGLLETSSLINPILFIAGETPDDFFRRTVHSGNIGPMLVSSTKDFYDRALTLPKLDNTQGSFYV